jgi:polyisoprenoid-binding protein YceI
MPRSTAIALVFASLASRAPAAVWEIDPAHTSVGFSVRHLMVSNVRGVFGDVRGQVNANQADLAQSTIEVTIAVASVDTRNAKRDEHLKTADFFDAAKHPTMTFKSRKAEPSGAGRWKVIGDLTLRGVTREVVLDVEGPTPEIKDPWGNVRAGARATTRINRKDFGMTWSKTLGGGGLMVGDEVEVTIEVEATRKPAS